MNPFANTHNQVLVDSMYLALRRLMYHWLNN